MSLKLAQSDSFSKNVTSEFFNCFGKEFIVKMYKRLQ